MTTELLSYSLIPLLSALAIPFLGRKNRKITEILANVTLLAGLANLAYMIFHPMNRNSGYAVFSFDGLTMSMLFTIYLVAICCVFFASVSGMVKSEKNSFYPLVMISVSAMSSMVLAKDFFTLYIFMEALAVTSFALIASEEGTLGIEGAIKYLLLTFPASALIIIGISLMLLAGGSLRFDIMSQSFSTAHFAALAFITLGFAIKAGLFPFHFWTPDAYQGAPAAVSAYLAGVVTKISGMYALVKICMAVRLFGENAHAISSSLLLAGVITLVFASIAALTQKDMKRMLAFSSISQMGYIAAGAATLNPIGILGAILHIFNHATFKTVLFLNSASIEKSVGTTDMRKMGGLEKNMPFTSWTSIIALFSTAGVPPLSGFWSKLLIIISLWITGFKFAAVVALIFSIVTLAYFMTMQKKVFFGKPKEELKEAKEASPSMLAPAVLMSLIIVFSGIFFPYVFDFLEKTL
ncbi:MAG: NADH-quinone oxidoreductase subunit L [Elusimicrobia bacterium]|nr:NADH-quinone oxidoreductase subunit L [Elusimicrobiota bacterium]